MAKTKAEQNQEILLENLLKISEQVNSLSIEKLTTKSELSTFKSSIANQLDSAKENLQKNQLRLDKEIKLSRTKAFEDFLWIKKVLGHQIKNDKAETILQLSGSTYSTLNDLKNINQTIVDKVWYLRFYPYVVGLGLATLMFFSIERSRDAFESGRKEGVQIANKDFSLFLESSPNALKEYHSWSTNKKEPSFLETIELIINN